MMWMKLALAIAFVVFSNGLANAQKPPNTFGTEWGTGQTICTEDGDEQTVNASDPSYARAAAWDARYLGDVSDACAAELTPIDGGTWGQSRPFRGADAQGRSAEFRLYVLSDQYAWKLGSSSEILDNGVPAELSVVLGTPQFQDRFCNANAAFSVGAASHEGPTGPNRRLAAARGETIINQLKANRTACPPGQIPILFAINLGEHQNRTGCTTAGGCSGDSAPQRRVVTVAAEDITLGVDLEEALRAGIEQQNVFRGFSVDDYDLFDVVSY
ncbi:MAG: hypothetical protein AAFX86_12595 [Pseudomonadota bacterium]